MNEKEDVVEIIPTLKTLVERFSGFRERTNEVLRKERRARKRDEPEEMAELLQELQRKLNSVNESLEKIEEVGSDEKKEGKKKNRRNKKRARNGEEEGARAVAVAREQGRREMRAIHANVREEEEEPEAMKKPRAKKLIDGGVCSTVGEDATLFYFALPNKLEDDKSFECPLLSVERTVVVERNQLYPVDFATLSENERGRYLVLLEADVSKRFQLNAPLLFKDHGGDMLKARNAVIEDPSRVGSFFESLARYAIASKQLSAASNTVLMLAASLHVTLSKSNEQGWYASFRKQIADFCGKNNCSIKASTVERYLVAGSLMLRSRVMACMLPSFLALNSGAMDMLLDNVEVVQRWEKMFEMMEIEGEREEEEEQQTLSNVVGSNEQEENRHVEEVQSTPDDFGALYLGEEHLSSGNQLNDNGPDEVLHLIADPTSAIADVADEKEEENCSKCGLTGSGIFLACDGPGKNHYFCWRCNGYSTAPPAELMYPGAKEKSICTVVFCKRHLELEACLVPYKSHVQRKNDQQPVSIQDFVNLVQAEEAQHIVRIFYENEYSLVPIKRNGWCIFESVVAILKLDLAKFVKNMKLFAQDYLKEETNTAFFAKPQLCRGLWNQLDLKEKTSIDGFRSTEAADLLIPMIAEYLNLEESNSVKICTWCVEKGELVKSPYEYPKEQAGEVERTINLFKSNLFVEHFDLMLKK
jgi:hypothetical protein